MKGMIKESLNRRVWLFGALLAASRAIETNSDTLADLAYLRGRGTSLGGLRPKCSVIDDDGQQGEQARVLEQPGEQRFQDRVIDAVVITAHVAFKAISRKAFTGSLDEVKRNPGL